MENKRYANKNSDVQLGELLSNMLLSANGLRDMRKCRYTRVCVRVCACVSLDISIPPGGTITGLIYLWET